MTKQTVKTYQDQLQLIWNNYKELYSLSSNPIREITRLASVIRVYSRQLLKIEDIKDRFEKAKLDKNISELRRIQYTVDKMADEKAYKAMWPIVSSEYDEIVKGFIEAHQDEEIKYTISTSVELYEKAKEYHINAQAEADAKAIEEMLLDL